MPIKAFKTGKQYSTEPQLDDVAPVIDVLRSGGAKDVAPSSSPLDRTRRKSSKRTPKDKIEAALAASTPPVKEGALVRHVMRATAAEIVCAMGNTGEVVLVGDRGTAICRQRILNHLSERKDWPELREQINELDGDVLGRSAQRLANPVTPAADAALAIVKEQDAKGELFRGVDLDIAAHATQEPHLPAAVALAFRELKYNAKERVRLILDIAYDAEQSGGDRLAAIELLDKTVVRCHKLLVEDAAKGKWSELVERSIIQGIVNGDKHAMEIAIASGKVEGYKLPDKQGGGTAVQVNVQQGQADPFANLSPEKRSRLAEMDRLIMGGSTAPQIIDIAPTNVVSAEPLTSPENTNERSY